MARAFSERDAAMYREYGPELIRFATGLVGPNDAADVVQSAVVRAMTSSGWERVINHRAYLYRSVMNEANSQHRSAMRRRAREIRTANPAVEYPQEVRPEVLEALAELSPRQRAVMFLTYWEDLDEAGVAERLGIGRGSVRRHLGRGREKLRQVLDE
jgi:RNA polymerase sigma factor (sigma-70 family)